jgi:hypothetical protein
MASGKAATRSNRKAPAPAIDLGVLKENPDQLYSNEAAAAFLGVLPNTPLNWRYLDRGPPYYTVGRQAYYRAADLAAFLSRRRHEPPAA